MTRDLAELLERVKAATGPDREIDAAIWLRFTPGATRKTTRVRHKTGAEWDIDETRDATGYLISVPEFTASLDAALALVEREFSGGLGWWVEMETAGMGAVLHGPDGEEFKGGGVGKDLPTALLAALLSALIAQPASGDVGSATLSEES